MIDWNQDLLLIDKPRGITSFDVIRRLRKEYTATHDGAKAPKMGHAGTLDPLATGLMLIGVTKGTKALTSLTKLEKEYVAEIRVGESRTTGDLEGDIVEEKPVEEIFSLEKISSTLTTLIGTHTYTVSSYSAIKKDGVPMYKRARKAALQGKTLCEDELPKREMTVHEAEFLEVRNENTRAVITVRFRVASGTYIRSLAEAFGRKLGYPGCLQNLRRTQVGEYRIENAIELPEIK